jgi:TRAP-type transport system periplasmic protein
MTRRELLIGAATTLGLGVAARTARAQDVKKTIKTMRLAHGVRQGMDYDRGAHRFAELVEQYTRGEIQVKIFPSAQLGLEQDTAKDVQLGTLDLTLIAINNASMWHRPLDVMIMPFIWRNREHADAVINGPIGKELFENYRKASGIRIISFFEWGNRGIINRARPIEKPDDLKGLKIRVPKNPVMVDTYNALGSNATAIDWGELYSALQQGLADGLEGPPQGMLDMKFTDFLKYYSFVNVFYGLAVILINDRMFSALPAAHQQALLQAGFEAGEHQRWISALSHRDGLERLRHAGVKVNVVKDPQPFIDRVKPVWEKYKRQVGEELFAKVFAAK